MKIETFFQSTRWSSGSYQGVIWHQRGAPIGTSELLIRAKTLGEFSKALQALGGFFSFVKVSAYELLVGVDHIRSYPIFYGYDDSGFYISDDAEWVRQQVGDQQMDPYAKEEFQLAGYVTGPDTLFPRVKQLQAGECLYANTRKDKTKVEKLRYYRFMHDGQYGASPHYLHRSFDAVLKGSIDRLIKYANGRQIGVPLSAGYDSRLIASLLKERGYNNVVTFSYGVMNSKEVCRSREVANALGLKWIFVEYTSDLWREAWKSEQRKEYQKQASGWSSIAHLQDWLAVKILKEEAIVDDDCIFVPGHCCVTGLVPDKVFEAKRTGSLIKPGALAEALQNTHFSLVRNRDAKITFQQKIEPHLAQTYPLNGIESLTPEEFARQFMLYGWQERQAKFICNSVRVYESFDFDWWLPLWDKDVSSFWTCIPLELIERRTWYKEYVSQKFIENSKTKEMDASSLRNKENRLKTTVRNIVFSHTGLKSLFFVFYNKLLKKSDAMARSGRFDDKLFDHLVGRGFSFLGITVYVFIRDFGERLDPEQA